MTDANRSYRVLARLGEGGMATVYLALIGGEQGFRKLAALKVLRDQPGSDPRALREMFAHEARVSARCHHRNVVQIQDVCELDGKPALCMEYLDGQTYRQVKARATKTGGLPLFEQLRILAEAAHGLHHVHTLTDYDGSPLGLVHCDVSPENLFVTYDGQVKLLDFGIAQAHGDGPNAPGFRGKLGYLAPEHISGEPVDARADVFALGAMLWEAVGVLPFSGGVEIDEASKLRARIAGGEPNIRHVEPSVPEPLAQIIDRAVALEPTHRFADAEAFGLALEDYLHWVGAQPSAQSLSRFIKPLFQREREKLRAMIDPQLQLADRWDREHASAASAGGESHALGGFAQPLPQAGFGDARRDLEGFAPLSARAVPNDPAYIFTSASDTMEAEVAGRGRKHPLVSLSLIVVLASAAGLLLGWNQASDRMLTRYGAPLSSLASSRPLPPVGAVPPLPMPAAAPTEPLASADVAVRVEPDPLAARAGLTSEPCLTTVRALGDEMRRFAGELVQSEDKRARRLKRRIRRRAAQCAAGVVAKCAPLEEAAP